MAPWVYANANSKKEIAIETFMPSAPKASVEDQIKSVNAAFKAKVEEQMRLRNG